MDSISIGRCITITARHLRILRNRCLDEAGCRVGGAYFHVFMYFANHDGCSEKQAACAIGKDKTYVAKAVKKLAAQGMIVCRRDNIDARCRNIHLTPQGRAECEKAKKALRNINGIIADGIDGQQIDEFLGTLELMRRNIADRLGMA